ncbi:hypothetical protein PWT90_08751 [Aphanocladium album]|nr:hypothetical protein PWT90_08751 [Aphanocladium album]
MIQTQTQARLLERKQEVREQRDAMIRQREEAAAGGREVENNEPLPNPDDIDEMDIEVPGWATKGEWVLWLDLLTDTIKLVLYVTFFVLLTVLYTFPIHIMRDLLMTARDFLKRLNSVLRYRRAIQEMNRYPDATQAELDQENTCIICREDMRVWDLNANPGALDRIRPKKLPCGHILHLGCLKSWLERQQVCPTCRSPVTADRATTANNQNLNRGPAVPQLPNNGLQAAQIGFAQEPRFGRFAVDQPLLDPAVQAAMNVDALGRPINAAPQGHQRPNQPNVRPMEEFHEMIRDEEQRRQEAEDRVRRRWRRVFPADNGGAQSQNELHHPHSAPQPSAVSQIAPGQPSQASQSSRAASTHGQQQSDLAFQRMFPALQPNATRQVMLNQNTALRSHRLRTLSTMYSQASVLVRQEAEALRISNEQLQVLGQLVTELERLEASHHENADSPLPAPEALALDQLLSGNPPGLHGNRAVPSRTQSPVMMRHGATSYSASIPAGSPELPEGVIIPPGWTLMPLQRLDNQSTAHPSGTQRSSRASSAGPATSPLAEERNNQHAVPQAPTSQPSQRTNVHVLERIPGTNNFRIAGANGAGASVTNGTGDATADAQSGTILTQQQVLDRFFARGRGREFPSTVRPEGSTRSTITTSSTSVPTDEQLSTTTVAPASTMPSWGGSSQHFGTAARSEPTEQGTDASEEQAASSAASTAQLDDGDDDDEESEESSSARSGSSDEDDDEDEAGESSKAAGKAVTMEEVSDDEDD